MTGACHLLWPPLVLIDDLAGAWVQVFLLQRKCKRAQWKLLSNCRVQVFLLQRKCKWAQWKLAFKLPSAGFLLQRYNKKQLFAIVCSDFVLKSAHIFNFYTEYQEVTKHKKMTRLAHTVSKTGWGKTLSFLSKSFLSFSK